uniref:Variant surface glycoprotein 1125.3169 n=1 Tax=Trypanosoma brucei TaxID=5691 RepID=A0A1J0R9P0_9TRYP|nr:variant surface glycoprotein 1125.3169 [Trypanosoma brucei]
MEKTCTSTTAAGTHVGASFASVAAIMTKLVENCPERPQRQLTGDEIRQALSELKASASRTNIQTRFGKFVTTDCHGHSDSGQCVLYKGNVATAKGEIDTSTWSTQLAAAADTIDAITTHNEKVSQAQEKIRQAKEAIMTIMRLPLMPHSTPGMATINKTTTTGTDAGDNQKKCEQHHNNQTECEKLKCSYDANAADGRKCKPKEGKGKTNQGEGDGASGATAASAGCAAHKDKNTCENDKKDGKPSRAWRKGKDNESDLEKEMCQNGSFLVNKQLGLMAAFFLEFATF